MRGPFKTTVVNCRIEAFDVFMGRPGEFGNPFKIGRDGSLNEVLRKFGVYFHKRVKSDSTFRERALSLRGRRLGCYCVFEPWSVEDGGRIVCHVQIIARWLGS